MSVHVDPVHFATCHCGAVRLRLTLPNGIENPRRCDCSMCRRRGTVVASVVLANLEVVEGEDALGVYQFNTMTAEGEDALGVYQFNTMTAKHYFCTRCGIYTHHQRRSNPKEYGYNVGCLEGVNPFDLGEVPVFDGVNHPADRD